MGTIGEPADRDFGKRVRRRPANNKDTFMRPFRGKMMGLKKLKKRIGLGSKSNYENCEDANNYQPLQFHCVHGANIVLSNNKMVAKRHDSFCNGLAFTNRPVKINEKVSIKLLEVSENWSGIFRFGFISFDPHELKNCMPKYACPDLTNRKGCWAKSVHEKLAQPNAVFSFHVNKSGEVYFTRNGRAVTKGPFLQGVDVSGPLWAIVDVYGNSTKVELVRPTQRCDVDDGGFTPSNLIDMDNSLTSNFNNMSLNQSSSSRRVPGSWKIPRPSRLMSLPFHPKHGRNVTLTNENNIAIRSEKSHDHGYVFSHRPIEVGELLVIKILKTNSDFAGSLTFGLTSRNPSSILNPKNLPADSNDLLDDENYWVVRKNVCPRLSQGDELIFTITRNERVLAQKNDEYPEDLFHVDSSVPLWAMFDVFGATLAIRMFTSVFPEGNYINDAPTNLRRCEVEPFNSTMGRPATMGTIRDSVNMAQQVLETVPQLLSPAATTIVVVNALPASAQLSTSTSSETSPRRNAYINVPSPERVVVPLSRDKSRERRRSQDTAVASSSSGPQSPVDMTTNDCKVCFDKSADTCFYNCGHVICCYGCAYELFRGKGDGLCPICRAVIRDIMRLYKS